MDEIALHILDIAMNAVSAGAGRIAIDVAEDSANDRLEVRISDDGKGMDEEHLRQAMETFASEKNGRRKPIGLGLALLRQTAERCGGKMRVQSRPGRGTQVEAWMELANIDRPPLGDLESTIYTLTLGAPDVDVKFSHRVGGAVSRFDSAAVRRALGPKASLQSPAGVRAVRQALWSTL